MCNTTPNDETPRTPCDCRSPQYAYTDDLCPACEEARVEQAERDLDNQYFADACGSMTQDDWDADNDWLASAGWGEM